MTKKRPPSIEKSGTSIDWAALHRRLEAIRSALETGMRPSPGARKKILRERAAILALEPEQEETEQETLEVIDFLLTYEHYAIESSYVREVYPLRAFTPLPCTPPFVLGLINVRGQILSVVDLRTFFDLPVQGLTDLNKVIILHNQVMEFGILADAILGVRSIPLAVIQPSLPTLTGIREDYLRGVTDERVVILDAEKLLSDKRMIIHGQRP